MKAGTEGRAFEIFKALVVSDFEMTKGRYAPREDLGSMAQHAYEAAAEFGEMMEIRADE